MKIRMVFTVTIDVVERLGEEAAKQILDEKLRTCSRIDDLADDFEFVESSIVGVRIRR